MGGAPVGDNGVGDGSIASNAADEPCKDRLLKPVSDTLLPLSPGFFSSLASSNSIWSNFNNLFAST